MDFSCPQWAVFISDVALCYFGQCKPWRIALFVVSYLRPVPARHELDLTLNVSISVFVHFQLGLLDPGASRLRFAKNKKYKIFQLGSLSSVINPCSAYNWLSLIQQVSSTARHENSPGKENPHIAAYCSLPNVFI